MPDPETLDTRKRKRILEFVISGFPSGQHAIDYGSLVDAVVKKWPFIEDTSIQAGIANPDAIIAITKEWIGPTVLKLTFLDVPDQTAAIHIRDYIRLSVEANKLKLDHEIIREKPQPQTITLEFVPSSMKLFNVG